VIPLLITLSILPQRNAVGSRTVGLHLWPVGHPLHSAHGATSGILGLNKDAQT